MMDGNLIITLMLLMLKSGRNRNVVFRCETKETKLDGRLSKAVTMAQNGRRWRDIRVTVLPEGATAIEEYEV